MTRKQFAAIKAAQETMAAIQDLAEAVKSKPTTAYATTKQVAELAAKWNHDFKDCDPGWKPQVQQQSNAIQRAQALGAFVQA